MKKKKKKGNGDDQISIYRRERGGSGRASSPRIAVQSWVPPYPSSPLIYSLSLSLSLSLYIYIYIYYSTLFYGRRKNKWIKQKRKSEILMLDAINKFNIGSRWLGSWNCNRASFTVHRTWAYLRPIYAHKFINIKFGSTC